MKVFEVYFYVVRISPFTFWREWYVPSVHCFEEKAHVYLPGHIGGGLRTEEFLTPVTSHPPVCCIYNEDAMCLEYQAW